MSDCNCQDLDTLIIRVQQQEKTIAQLVEVIANTNNKVSYLMSKERLEQAIFTRT